jgi:predicted outer membrane repeat protein
MVSGDAIATIAARLERNTAGSFGGAIASFAAAKVTSQLYFVLVVWELTFPVEMGCF